MSVRLIAGRAGSGKTRWCQSQICEELAVSLTDGPRLIILVPEQAGLQMERSLLAASAGRALGRCEVLSFRRLAGRIFNESTGHVPVPLTTTGRQMALRYLLTKHRRSLREFAKVAEHGGFITQIAHGIAELLQEAVTVEQLDACAAAAAKANDPAAARLHDVALLYRAYLDYLADDRVDPDGVLDLARARLADAPWISNARIWIDGFAGLTQQQMRMIVALAKTASHVDIALLLAPAQPATADPDAAPDELSLFARTERTWAQLIMALIAAGVPIEETLKFDQAECPRFAQAKDLAQLEQRLFNVPPAPEADEANGAAVSDTCDPAIQTDATVRLALAPNRRSEVDTVVRLILDLVQRSENPLRYRDIAVIVRDLTPYHDLISARLRAHDIPFFIDRRRPTHHHPLIQLLRAATSLVAGTSFQASVATLLKSGLSGLPDDAADLLENYTLAHGLATPPSWDEAWALPVFAGRDDRPLSAASKQSLHDVELARQTLRRRFGDWWPAAGRQSHQKCRTWAEQLYALLDRFAVAKQLARWSDEAESRGDLDEAAEHERVWADVDKLLEEMVAALGDVRMSGRQFHDVLESALVEFTLGLVPATLDQVLVGSIERSRHPSIRAAFLLGFADGHFPARIAEESIFGDQERALFQQHDMTIGRTQRQKILDERMLAYVAVTRASEFLWISVPQSDEEGRALSPSPYWPWLRAALPNVHVELTHCDDPTAVSTRGDLAGGLATNLRDWVHDRLPVQQAGPWLALYEWSRTQADAPIRDAVARAMTAFASVNQAKLSQAATVSLWPAPHRTSVTRLETFAKCPFKHFATYGLRLTERPEHEVSHLHWGSFYHTVLEQFVNELIETGSTLQDLSTADIAQRIANVCQLVLPQVVEDLNLDEAEQEAVTWRSRLELPAAIEGQKAILGKSPLRPTMTEKQFGDTPDDTLPALELTTPAGQRVLVRGKIDRVDLLQVGDAALAVVFDYKRSFGSHLKLDEVYHGLALQLLAYLLVLRDHSTHTGGPQIVPGGAFYLPLLGKYEALNHPDEADKEGFTALDAFKPRGIVDFDWINQLDPGSGAKWSKVFSVYRKADGALGNVNASDAIEAGALPMFLDHVRNKMVELAGAWLDGDIRVRPARLGKDLPCSYCVYRGVCRIEFATNLTRNLPTMSRSEVLEKITRGPGDSDG